MRGVARAARTCERRLEELLDAALVKELLLLRLAGKKAREGILPRLAALLQRLQLQRSLVDTDDRFPVPARDLRTASSARKRKGASADLGL